MAEKKRRKRHKQPARGKGRKSNLLDRDIYARSRARGMNRGDSAKAAGSKAKTPQALSTTGSKLEIELGMLERIALEREMVIRQMDNAWDKARARMEQMLDHSKWAARKAAADFIAKVAGGYAAQKVDITASVENTPTGLIKDLDITERAELRALLEKAKKRREG